MRLPRREDSDEQVEERLPVDLADPQVTDVREDVVLGHVAVLLASARTHRVIAQEAGLAEFRDRHRVLAGRAGLFQESARVALFFLGYLVGPLVLLVGTRGLVLAVGRPVDTDVARPDRPARSIT